MSVVAPLGSYTEWAGHRTDVLARRYRADVLAYCRRRLPSHEEAEDAAQIVFLNVYRSLASGTRPNSESAWLFGISAHVVSHRLRTIARRSRVEFPAAVETLNVPAPARTTPDVGDLDVAAAVRDLPDLERRAFFLHEWQGFSYKEVAIELGVTPAAAGTLLRDGRRRLAGSLNGQRRRMRGFGVLWLPWQLMKWLAGPGTALKVGAGVASVAVIGLIGPPLGEQVLHGRTSMPRARAVAHQPHRLRGLRVKTAALSAEPARRTFERPSSRKKHGVATPRHEWPIVTLPSIPAPPPTTDPTSPSEGNTAPAVVDTLPSITATPQAGTASDAALNSADLGAASEQPSDVMPTTAGVCNRRDTPSNSHGNGDPSPRACPG